MRSTCRFALRTYHPHQNYYRQISVPDSTSVSLVKKQAKFDLQCIEYGVKHAVSSEEEPIENYRMKSPGKEFKVDLQEFNFVILGTEEDVSSTSLSRCVYQNPPGPSLTQTSRVSTDPSEHAQVTVPKLRYRMIRCIGARGKVLCKCLSYVTMICVSRWATDPDDHASPSMVMCCLPGLGKGTTWMMK